jgi:3-phosphoshikimate 1-carboxyvinyltransferase
MRVGITPSVVSGEVSAPPSKSYTHRAVILASLAAGQSVIENPLLSDDTLYTINACRSLGAEIEPRDNRLMVTGTGGQIRVLPKKERIHVGNSGSTIRMVAPLATLSKRRVLFDGDSRLRQRPIGDLITALRGLGVQARSLDEDGCPPIEVRGGDFKGGEVEISGLASSQHISSLLMIAPYTAHGLRVKVIGGLRSRPYIDVTIDVMQAFGIEVVNYDYREFLVKGNQEYKGGHYRIEGDYSSVSYLFAASGIGGKPVTGRNLNTSSIQGDRHLLAILSTMGCSVAYQREQVCVFRNKKLAGITADMGDYPDVVPTLAVVAAYAQGRTKITNISHLRFKETDRLSHTAAELLKMGIRTEATDSAMVVYGGKPKGAEIEAHGDHRMVMSFAVAALFAEGDSIINGAETISKSYPQFFIDLKKLGAKVTELS